MSWWREWLRRRYARRRARELDEKMLAEGYVRFGAVCGAGRRSMWVRTTPREVNMWDEAEALEIRTGREGDDFYQRIDRSETKLFYFAVEIVSSGTYHLEMSDCET